MPLPPPIEHSFAVLARRPLVGGGDGPYILHCVSRDEAEHLLPLKQVELPDLFDWHIVEL